MAIGPRQFMIECPAAARSCFSHQTSRLNFIAAALAQAEKLDHYAALHFGICWFFANAKPADIAFACCTQSRRNFRRKFEFLFSGCRSRSGKGQGDKTVTDHRSPHFYFFELKFARKDHAGDDIIRARGVAATADRMNFGKQTYI